MNVYLKPVSVFGGGGALIYYTPICVLFLFFLHRMLMSQMAYDLSLCPSICLITGDTAM